MKHFLLSILCSLSICSVANAQLIITGVYDGPLTGGVPKGVELYVTANIANLSQYGLGSANNGGGTDGQEFTFPAVAVTAGTFIYVSSESSGFTNFFGFAPNYVTGAMAINGDDAIELFGNGVVIDLFGDINVAGTGQSWDYMDGWAYRASGTSGSSTFTSADWIYSGINALDNETSNSTAVTPFPIGTYTGTAVSTKSVSFLTTSSTVNENVGTVTVTVEVTNPDASAVTVNVGVSGSSTTSTGDYSTTFPISLTIGANVNTQTFSITITDDLLVEVSENLVLDLTSPTGGAVLGTNTSYTLTIEDNDYATAPIAINEIMYDNPDTDNLEFIELYNYSNSTVDLTGYSFSSGITFTFPAFSIAAGDYVVLARNATVFNTFYGFVPDFQWTSGSLSNTTKLIKLVNATNTTVDSVVYSNVAPWTNLANNFGHSLALCNATADNANAKNWLPSVTYTGAAPSGLPVFSTPNATNAVVCTNSNYPYADIGWINTVDAAGVADSIGVQCQIQGTVYGVNVSSSGLQFTIIDSKGDGIGIFSNSVTSGYVVNEGDYITIKGTINQFNGLLQISPIEIVAYASNVPLLNPTTVLTLDESTESNLVKIENVTLVNPAQWTNTGSGFNVDITNGVNTFSMRIDADVDIFGNAAPTGTFDAIGLVGQYDATSPYTEGYQLFPRYLSDVGIVITPIVAFSAGSINTAENNSPSINVTITNPTNIATTVEIVLDGSSTATNGSDFTYTTAISVVFPANSSANQTITIPIIDDAILEGVETIVLKLQNPTNGAVLGADSVLTISILDNDATIDLVITEIMYNSPAFIDVEFIEIYNKGALSLNLQDYKITAGITHTFPSVLLNPNEYLVITNDSSAFFNAYGFMAAQWTSGTLDNTGESIVLKDNNGIVLDSVKYADSNGWSAFTDGGGASLVLCDANADNNNSANWQRAITATGFIEDCQKIYANPGVAASCATSPIVSLKYHCLQYDEGYGTFDVAVFLDGADSSSTDVTVSFVAGASTATVGTDFSFTNPTVLTFPANSDTSINIPITIVQDSLDEGGDEIITLIISSATNGAVITNDTIIITIIEDDFTPEHGLIITGVFDGPLSGGSPKGIELYSKVAISDLSKYGLGSANNGGGTDGQEFTFPAVSLPAGSFIYVTNDTAQFNAFFGFNTNYLGINAAGINGDDAVELFENGVVYDVFGDINVDGTGQSWDYLDGWAYRSCSKDVSATFDANDWTFGGINSLEGGLTNTTCTRPFPNATYNTECICPVEWTDLKYLALNNNTLTKTSGGNGWSSAANSAKVLGNGTDGWVAMEILETNTWRAFGLAIPNTVVHKNSITYGFLLRDNGKIMIAEGTSSKGIFGDYNTGDILKIERIGTTINYLKNGVVIYTSATTSTTDLIVDLSIQTIGGTIHNVTSDFTCVDCGAFELITSVLRHESCAGANDGEITIASNNEGATFQWSDDPSETTNTRTGLAPGTYTVTGSTGFCTYNLNVVINVGTACENTGCPVTWTNVTKATVTGNTLKRTATGSLWDAGASTNEVLASGANGWASMQVAETNIFRTFGLSAPNTSASDTINYAFVLRNNGVVLVTENAVQVANLGTYATGDIFKVERVGTTIFYYQNGVVEYVSTVPSTTNLVVDASIKANGGTIYNVRTNFSCVAPCPIVWTSLNKTTVSGTTITKTGTGTGWDGAAKSAATLPSGANGYASMEVLETNTFRVFGLSTPNTTNNNTDITYAFQLRDNGIAQIVQNGVLIGSYGAYNTGDVFKVERFDTLIEYYHNNVLLYTSAIGSTTALIADMSIRTVGGTIHNVQTTFSCVASRPESNVATTSNISNTNVVNTFSDVTAYPNPFSDELILNYTENVEDVKSIELYNINGQHIRSIAISQDGQTTIDTSTLESGMYIISINGVKHLKVVKM